MQKTEWKSTQTIEEIKCLPLEICRGNAEDIKPTEK